MDFNGKRVIVTGGLGFIGANLAQQPVNLGATATLVDSLIPEYGGDRLANTEVLCRRLLSLPMYPELSEEQVARVCSALSSWRT